MRVFTVPPDAAFIGSLIDAILAGGFPDPAVHAPGPADLAKWTILVPTRRAARALQQAFVGRSGALLLPRIRPIGDVEEDLIEPVESALGDELPEEISTIGRELLLIRFIEEWAEVNPQERLAQEIRQSPVRALALARGLAELVDSFETEEADLANLGKVFDGDLALHRLAILGFLAIVREKLPAELAARNRIGPMERRSRLIRLEAERVRASHLPGPIIAAGSTGSIPATAELLKAIAEHQHGAVVLPGLDQDMDEASWTAVSPQHPQYALKRLLEAWRLSQREVRLLPGVDRRHYGSARSWLASEIMRPPETAEGWRDTVSRQSQRIGGAMEGVELIEAHDRREEALAIALVLRKALTEPKKTAALVTPDRDLARRVKAELKRWTLDIEDSAGEPLSRFPQGSLLTLIIDNAIEGYEAEGLGSLLHHPLLAVGMNAEDARSAANLFDVAVLRYGRRTAAPGRLRETLEHIQAIASADRHLPDLLRRLHPRDWDVGIDFARRLDHILGQHESEVPLPLAEHLRRLIACAEQFSAVPGDADAFWTGPAAEPLSKLVEALEDASPYWPARPFASAGPLIRDHLEKVPVRAPTGTARLAILGLLEARLVRPDIIVLGGLNEGRWPAQPHSGPWLNRPMRDTLGLAMPERHIGQTAHDFVQAFGAETVHLTWSRRVGDAPAVPSRFVLRLRTLLEASGASPSSSHELAIARGLGIAPAFAPIEMPRVRPPLEARPKQLSFTEIEVLIRDPYAVYVRKVLRLEPLRAIAENADAALRGQLIHEALSRYGSAHPGHLPENAAFELTRLGQEVFAPYMAEPDVAGFWWPRFRRIAPWFVEQDRELRRGVASLFSEVSAEIELDVKGAPFKLTGRADRIDALSEGGARIIDFKTGDPPSPKHVKLGLNPQLTLEAAVLEKGGFFGVPAAEATSLLYVKLSGGSEAGRLQFIECPAIGEMAREHLAGLEALLVSYADEEAAYIPRHIPKVENERSPFDHLSRWGEWALKEMDE
ncbi:MAG: double-strand break repair protein AddB [Hyphomicrobiales bacterium]